MGVKVVDPLQTNTSQTDNASRIASLAAVAEAAQVCIQFTP